MAFSLSSWFKSKPAAEQPEAPAAAKPIESPAPPPAAPAAPPQQMPRVTRTVTPKSAQPTRLHGPSLRPSVAVSAIGHRATASVPPASMVHVGAQRTAAGVPAGDGSAPAARKISFGAPGASPFEQAPAPVADPAPPLTEMEVTLEVGDFIDRLPPSFLRTGSVNRQQAVRFATSELYSDLARGRASVPASTVYRKCPEIFARPVSETEDVEVPLPLQKLVEQMGTVLHTRPDQVAEENVAQIETPFLQVALEDGARVPAAPGSSTGATVHRPGPPDSAEYRAPHRTGHISTISPVKMAADHPGSATPAPPSAQSSGPIILGKRPPSTVRASVAGGKIRLSGPESPTRMAPVHQPLTAQAPSAASSPSHQVTKKTARIQIPPISLRAAGAQGNARPMPAPPQAPAVQPGPVSIRPAAAEAPPTFRAAPLSQTGVATFRSTPPPAPPTTIRPPQTVRPVPPSFNPARTGFPPPAFPAAPPKAPLPGLTAESTVPAPPAAPAPARNIQLSLRAVLRSLPFSTLSREPSSVPDDVRATFPFALIEPQLSQGRVVLPIATFIHGLPEGYTDVIGSESGLTEIHLPLQEVFQNLPAEAITLRSDQVVEEAGFHFPTPFSQKAEEDAARLAATVSAAPVPPPVEARAPEIAAPAIEPAPAAEPVAEELAPEPPAAVEIPASLAEPPPMSVEPPVIVEDVLPAEPTVEPLAAEAESAPIEPDPAPSFVLPPLAESLPAAEADQPAWTPEVLPAAPAEAELPTILEEPAAAAAPAVEAPKAPPAPAPAKPAFVRLRERDTELQALFMTEDDLDAKTIVRLVTQLPGVSACTIMFGDGLLLAGNFPENGSAEGFCAMAPPFFKRAENFAAELELGTLDGLTLYTTRGLVSFFMSSDICLSVRHSGRGFLPGVREKIEIITRELAKMYAPSEPM